MKIEVFKRRNQWHFRIKSRNGRIVAQSERYKQKTSALDTIRRIRNGVCSAEIIDISGG